LASAMLSRGCRHARSCAPRIRRRRGALRLER
jgi:hypothetical protein